MRAEKSLALSLISLQPFDWLFIYNTGYEKYNTALGLGLEIPEKIFKNVKLLYSEEKHNMFLLFIIL